MQLRCSRWGFDASAIELDEQLGSRIDVRLDIPDEEFADLFVAGTWWLVPFARRYTHRPIGVRVMPATPLASSPIVVAREHTVATIASCPAVFVPVALFYAARFDEKAWSAIAKLSKDAWRAAETFHEALGGTKKSLEAVRRALADRTTQAKIVGKKASANDKVRTQAAVLGAIDPSSRAYFDWVSRVAVALTLEPEVPDVPAYRRAMASRVLGYHLDNREDEFLPLARQAAWELLRGPAGLDIGTREMTLWTAVDSVTADETLVEAASLLGKQEDECPGEWKKHPIWKTLSAVASGKAGGKEHADAADKLEKLGLLEQAFDARASAAFWSFTQKGKANGKLLEQARTLAKKAAWPDALEALEVLIEARDA